MEGTKIPSRAASPWQLAERQHGVVSRAQLLDYGLSSKAIEHRIKRGRLHPLWRGVYAVGRPEVDNLGRWMAAALSCGSEALLAYRSAAALWGMIERDPRTIEVVVPRYVARRRPGIRVHRRSQPRPIERRVHRLIPVTSPSATLIDLATQTGDDSLEAAIIEDAEVPDRADPQ